MENLQKGQKLLTEVLDKIKDNTRHIHDAEDDASKAREEEKLVPGHSLLFGLPEIIESVARIPPLETEDLDEETKSKLDKIQHDYEAFVERNQSSWSSAIVTSSMQPLVTPTQTEQYFIQCGYPQ